MTIIRRLKNYGRSPALLRRESLVVRTEPDLAPEPDYRNISNIQKIVAVGGWYGTVENVTINVLEGERDQILNQTRNMYVYGFLEYTDSLRRPHAHRFCYRLIFGEGNGSVRYIPDGPDAYWETT